ncbi:MAG: 4a-hydroxytetrahydrobiopterin dehydratase [Nocardioidaceae bacterium]
MPELLPVEAVDAALADDLGDWARDDDTIVREVTAKTFAGGIKLVDEVAVIADRMDHHPDIDIRWTTIRFALSTHSAGGLTSNDLELARKIQTLVSAGLS